ncbi:DUF4145 domain-containing protein [Ruegeria arenilitoris]|uniref:DUF4145 domain-containing protein n=1 Tax=Ruegeria arenilitoris TaxID=1173585 RepID=UPI001479EBD4|nr:DUF4145 domain-containing protein [Ruegeria arenilitoris]
MHKSPSFGEIRFSCPHCGALAHQYWATFKRKPLDKDQIPIQFDVPELEKIRNEQLKKEPEDRFEDFDKLNEYIKSGRGAVFSSVFREDPYVFHVYNLSCSTCDSCGEIAIWMNSRMVFPTSGPAGVASEDMPQRVKELFDEAGAVFTTSPRASAALLRLALQHLLIELGGTGKDINSDINSLIDNGLDDDTAKTMHALRIIGNESVHPGVISVDDEPYIAEGLFDLLNQVVDQLISRPKRRKELWDKLPASKREHVEKKLSERKSAEKGA